MNLRPRIVFVVLLAMSAPLALGAKAKGKGKPGAAKAPASSPGAALAPYINNIDPLLALQRPAGKGNVLFAQAPGRIVTLRQQFTSEREAAAEGERAKYDAAIATCDALTKALDERQKVLGDIRTSQAVKGSGKLDAGPRKDNLTQGIKGGNTSKAVGAIVERDRERAAARKAAQANQNDSDALTAMSVNRWNKRAVELRQQITDSYARIK